MDSQVETILGKHRVLDDTTSLTIKDLPFILMAMIDVSGSYRKIGIHFGLSPNVWDKTYSNDIAGLICVLAEWLNNWSGYGPPTWKKIVIAVATRSGGDNLCLSDDIAENYLDYGHTMFENSHFDSVDDTTLTSVNQVAVFEELSEVSTKWTLIALYLGISYRRIEELKLLDTLDNQIIKMVDIWLKQNYDIEVFGKPTWRKLVIAVAAKSGGSHRYQATEIAKKYPMQSASNGVSRVAVDGPSNGTSEKPCYDADAKAKCNANITLEDPPQEGTREYNELQKHCEEVEIILHTVNDNEHLAALTYMKSPSEDRESNGVQNFPNVGMVVGVFAKKKVVLIQTDQGNNCEKMVKDTIDYFPSAQYILAVGVCYGFDREKHLLGDVLVSKQISDFNNFKYMEDGTIENRGETKNVNDFLFNVFCKRSDIAINQPLKVTNTRDAKVYIGTFLSCPILMNNKKERNKFSVAAPTAIGGEMEGGVLMKLEKQEPTIKGVIIIKGVVDYGDGMKNKEWQFTTAMAAFQYTETKLKSANIPRAPSQHTTES